MLPKITTGEVHAKKKKCTFVVILESLSIQSILKWDITHLALGVAADDLMNAGIGREHPTFGFHK